jgi:hypothetical protein
MFVDYFVVPFPSTHISVDALPRMDRMLPQTWNVPPLRRCQQISGLLTVRLDRTPRALLLR